MTGEAASTISRAPTEERDGRRLRSQDSRARIVAAMLALIREGETSPSAEMVAGRANVGLRTVFRHFKDMDSLYREMSEVIEEEVLFIKDLPFTATDWRGKLIELIDRRLELFERIAPFKRASDINRHRSRFLGRGATRLTITLREILSGIAPPQEIGDPKIFEALDLLLSFEAWSRMRLEQHLSQDEVRDVLRAVIGRLTA
ncbi:TetR/AcrR family transcriptional regulator [Phenylobacterium sp.]|uniref:TetR/AcrR family transcriptional regulator n=1 Tax=Phenylobacterium sp. TaxID=1871053 RepID=UPI0035AFFD5E